MRLREREESVVCVDKSASFKFVTLLIIQPKLVTNHLFFLWACVDWYDNSKIFTDMHFLNFTPDTVAYLILVSSNLLFNIILTPILLIYILTFNPIFILIFTLMLTSPITVHSILPYVPRLGTHSSCSTSRETSFLFFQLRCTGHL